MTTPATLLLRAAAEITGIEAEPKIRELLTEVLPATATAALPSRPWTITRIAVTDCWAIHGTRTFTPTPSAFTAITGANGIGKSAMLIAATTAALSGVAPGGKDAAVVREGSTKGTIELDFEAGRRTYRVTRIWSTAGRQNAVLEELVDDALVKIAVGTTKVLAHLRPLVGDATDAAVSWSAAQGDSGRFSLLEPRDRFMTLAALFDLSAYAEWQKAFHSRAKAERDRLLALRGKRDAITSQQAPAGDPLFAAMSDDDVLSEGGRLADLVTGSQHRPLAEQAAQYAFSQAMHASNVQVQAAQQQLDSARERHNQLDVARAALADLRQRSEELSTSVDSADAAVSSLERDRALALSAVSRIEEQIAELRGEGNALIAARDALVAGHGAECATCGQELPAQAHQARRDDLDRKLAAINARGSALATELAESKSKDEAIRANLRSAQEAARAAGRLSGEASANLSSAVQIIEQLQDAPQRLADAEVEFAQVQQSAAKDAAQAQQVLDAALRELPDALDPGVQIRLEALRSERQRRLFAAQFAEDSAAQLRAVDQEIGAVSTQLQALDALDSAAGRKGVPSMLIRNRLDDLSTEITEILHEAGSQIAVAVQIGDTDSTADKVTMFMSINGATVPYLSASGGQRFLIDLATRVALTRMMGQETGMQAGHLFIDEGWGVLDASNRTIAVALVQRVAQAGTAVVTVTHDDQVADAADYRVHVER